MFLFFLHMQCSAINDLMAAVLQRMGNMLICFLFKSLWESACQV